MKKLSVIKNKPKPGCFDGVFAAVKAFNESRHGVCSTSCNQAMSFMRMLYEMQTYLITMLLRA
jgi:hypothetical protein